MGSDLQVNTSIPGDQYFSSVLLQSDNSYWVIWDSDAAGASGFYGRHYDVNGAPLGGEVLLKTGGGVYPTPWLLPDDGWVLIWNSTGDGDQLGVFGQRYDASGNMVGSQFQVNTSTMGNQESVGQVRVLESGGWVVIWDSSPGMGDYTSLGIYGQLYDASGNTVGAEFRIDGSHGVYQNTNWVEALPDGGWLTSYSSYSESQVYARRYDADGNSVGSEFQFTTDSTSFSIFRVLQDGGWVAAWNASRVEDVDGGVFAKRFDASGSDVGSDFRVNTTTAGNQCFSDITALPDGGWLILWTTYQGYDPVTYVSDSDFYGQRYDVSGNPVGGEVLINTNVVWGGWGLALADGGWVVHWVNDDGDGEGVAAQRYDVDGNPVGGVIQVNDHTTGDQGLSSVEALPDGGWVVTWDSDGQDGSGDGVYMQRYDVDGNPVGTGSGGGGSSIVGTAGDDTILGTAANDLIDGLGGNDNLNGANGNDTLYGGLGNDTLYGASGVDRLYGGKGNDTYLIDATSDVVIENSGAGVDTVKSPVTYALTANVEKLELVGIVAINGTGNGMNNVLNGNNAANKLWGNAGADTLNGYAGNDTLNGGGGVDTLKGNKGNDLYVVDNKGDKVTEYLKEGYDTVQSSVTYMLTANVEKLVLTGASAINGTGNGMNNVLVGNGVKNKLWGNNGNDSLYGGNGNDTLLGGGHSDLILGGMGNDQLTGGAGPDYFVFNTALNASTNVDTITDFTSGVDKIRLDDDIFTGLGFVTSNTLLTNAQFYQAVGATAAHDADDRIVYNTSTGALFYDADGVGGAAAVKFAMLGTGTHPSIVASDFVVIA